MPKQDGDDCVYQESGGSAKPMADKYNSPYRVLERGNKAWKVQVGERVEILSRDRLKPHLGSVGPKAAVPLRRGRPRVASAASVALASSAAKLGGRVTEPGRPPQFLILYQCDAGAVLGLYCITPLFL